MFVLGNGLRGLAVVLNFGLQMYIYVLIGRVIVSWVDASPYNPIVRFLYVATEPPLRAIRSMLPRGLRFFPLDITPLILFALIYFVQIAVVGSIYDLGVRLR
jgi:YggT family protein